MITIQARGWQQFLAAFGVLRGAGVEPVAGGGNQMRVPDDTCRDVLRAVAATGAAVHADLTEPVPAEPTPEPSDAATDSDAETVTEPEPDPPPADDDTDADEEPPAAADKPPAAPAKRTPRKATRSRRTRNTAEE